LKRHLTLNLTLVFVVTLSLLGCTPFLDSSPYPSSPLPLNSYLLASTPTHARTAFFAPFQTQTPNLVSPKTRTLPPDRLPTPTPTRLTPPSSAIPFSATPLLSSSGPFQPVISLGSIGIGIIQDLYIPDAQTAYLAGTFGMVRINLQTNQVSIARFFDSVLGVDPSGHAWVLPPKGETISSWDGTTWNHYGYRQGWIRSAQLSTTPGVRPQLLSDNQGNIWMATSLDIRRFDGKRWRVFNAAETGILLPYRAGIETVFSLAINPDGSQTWAASCDWGANQPVGGGGLRRFDGQRWTNPGFPLENACITTIEIDLDGVVWVAAGTNFYSFHPVDETWSIHEPPQPEDLSRRYLYTRNVGLLLMEESGPL